MTILTILTIWEWRYGGNREGERVFSEPGALVSLVEPITPARVFSGHLGRRVAELLLDVKLLG